MQKNAYLLFLKQNESYLNILHINKIAFLKNNIFFLIFGDICYLGC